MKIRGRFKIVLPVVLIVLAAVCACWIFERETNRTVVPEYVFTYAENQAEDYPTTEGGKTPFFICPNTARPLPR